MTISVIEFILIIKLFVCPACIFISLVSKFMEPTYMHYSAIIKTTYLKVFEISAIRALPINDNGQEVWFISYQPGKMTNGFFTAVKGI